MINKIIPKRAVRFVPYILLSVLVLLVAAPVFIYDAYGRKPAGNHVQVKAERKFQVRFFIGSSFHGKMPDDTISFTIIKKDRKNVNRYFISGTYLVSDQSIYFSLKDSLVLNYQKWNVPPDNRISYSATGISVSNFVLNNDSAKISVTNTGDGAGSPVDISIQNFDIRNITGFFNKDSLMVSGLIDAKILVGGFGKMLDAITATASVRNLELMQKTVGDLRVNAEMTDDNAIRISLGLAGNGNDISAGGDIFLNNNQQQLEATLNIKKLQLSSLVGFMKGNMTLGSGTVNGLIGLKGKFTKPEWSGSLNFDTTKFTLNQFGTTYTIDSQKITLDYPAINFNRFTIKDSLDHPFIINGMLCSNMLSGYDLDIDLNSRDFTLINTPRAIKNQIYGYAGINANVSISGNTVSPAIEGDIHLNEKTDVTLLLPEKNIDKDASVSVVRFIDRDTFALPERIAFKPAVEAETDFTQYLNYKLNILPNKDAALTIVIDPTTGDELKVKGVTKLNAGIEPGGKMIVGGIYRLDSGYYELNYQFLQRRFNLMKGSIIDFNGSPTNAKIDIRAEYIVNTAPKDLLGNEVGSVDPAIARSFYHEIPFSVILFLKGSLNKPAISFDIQLSDERSINNKLRTTVENKLVQLRADVAAINKQVFALLALDRFVGEQSTDFFKGNDGDFSAITKESVSKFLSAALDQIASDLFTGINIDLNLNSYKDFATSDETKRTDLNVEVSKNFLNDRLNVTVGRDFGIESQDGSTKASQQKASRFLPDVTVNYKLSTDGKYMIRSYKKNPFEVVMDGYVVETGLAFIVTMDYDLFNQLFTRRNKKTGQ